MAITVSLSQSLIVVILPCIKRAEALKSFQKNPFFSAWDRTALELYAYHGTYNTTDSATGQPVARLKMAPMQECLSYMGDGLTQQETFERLQTLDERVILTWIVPGNGEDFIGRKGNTERRVWLRTKNANNVKIKKAGHLVRFYLFLFGRSVLILTWVGTYGGAERAR